MAKRQLNNLLNVEEDQFPGNSIASRTMAPIRVEQPTDIPVEPPTVVSEEQPKRPKVIRRRKSITRSIRETFFGEEARNVLDHVVSEVFVPAAKSLLSDMFTQAIEMLIFGEVSGRRRSVNRGEKTIVSYNKMYERDERRIASPRRDRFGLEDIFFEDGQEASEVLDAMGELLEKYRQITVADYYDLAGLDGATHAFYKWGWTSVKKAYCTHTREGYCIVMPTPQVLE